MIENLAEKSLSKVLSFGTFAVTIFILSGTNGDPVNVTKLAVLGGVSLSAAFVTLVFTRERLVAESKPVMVIAFLLLLTMFSAMHFSDAPLEQNFFGTFGRNTGFLTYFLLILIMLSASTLRNKSSFDRVAAAFFVSGAVNILYCGWVLAFGDFLAWSNPSGKILGLFGNPDFISAFLGMYITGACAYAADPKTRLLPRLLLVGSIFPAFFEILSSKAIQGLMLTAGGLAVVGFYLVKSKFVSLWVSLSYLAVSIALGILAVLGSLRVGPLSFIYKRSVSLRGSYWQAGIEMGNSHPWTGIGLDTYGDWYRSSRPPVALIDTPGVSVLSNVSHNVVIDFFASGGWPLLISYLATLALGAFSIVRITLKSSNFDRNFVILASVWLCYQAQSIISINQIGLAIWGWLFTGLLVAYDHSGANPAKNPSEKNKGKSRRGLPSQGHVISPNLISGVGAIIGLLLASPPLNADVKYFNATKSQNVAMVEAALVPGFMNPSDSFRYAQAVNLFQASNLPELALKYARIGIMFNPDYFDAWKQIYLLPNSTNEEKAVALSNMRRLDPNNPDVTLTQ